MVTQKFFGRLGPFGLSCLFVVGVVLFSLNFFLIYVSFAFLCSAFYGEPTDTRKPSTS